MMETTAEEFDRDRERVAEDLYARFVADRELDPGLTFESWVREHAELEPELRRVHDDCAGLEAGLHQVVPPEGRDARVPRRSGEVLEGKVLSGKYLVHKLIGKGGYGTVYSATDVVLGARVAVKILKPEVAEREGALNDFLHEARLLTTVDHENIVRWITFDTTDDGLHYFVMEHLQGEELQDVLDREGKLPARQAQQILLQVLAALKQAHGLEEQLLHLDLKPQNVYVLDEEPIRIKVIDFGIGQHVGAAARQISGIQPTRTILPPKSLEDTIATAVAPNRWYQDGRSGVRRARGGTLLYSSPEQVTHLIGMPVIVALDGRSDLYSLGVMAFKMLTGRYPFQQCSTVDEAIENHLHVEPSKVGSMGVRIPRNLAAFVDRCLVKDREKRWKDSGEAYEALLRIVHPGSSRAWGIAASAFLAVLLAILWVIWPEPPLGEVLVEVDGAGTWSRDVGLYAGPDRRHFRLQLRSVAEDVDRGTDPRLVRDTDENAGELAGWKASWDGQDIALEAPEGGASFEELAYLELPTGSGARQYSAPARLVYIGPGAWSIASFGVEGADGRDVDAFDHDLSVVVHGRRVDIGGVRVSHDGRWRTVPEGDSDRSDTVRFEIPLTQFGLTDGSARFVVEVTDLAGHMESLEQTVPIAAQALRFEKVEVEGAVPGQDGAYIVTPDATPILIAVSSREANLTWSVLDARGEPLQDGTSVSASREHRIELGDTAFKGRADYAGTLLARASDYELVLRDPASDRGNDEWSRPFKFTKEIPSFRFALTEVGSERIDSLDDRTFYTNEPQLVLDVDLENEVAQTIELVHDGQDPQQETLIPAQRTKARFQLLLPGDGHHPVQLRAYRYDVGAERTLSRSEFERTLDVVLDRSAPKLAIRIDGEGPDFVVRSRRECEAALVNLMLDDEGTIGDVPVNLAWTLELEGTGTAVARGDIASLSDPRSLSEVGLPYPSQVFFEDPQSRSRDGEYVLTVQGSDAAGNEIEPAVARWILAEKGPLVRIESPSPDGVWHFDSATGRNRNQRWKVQVTAFDRNGVHDITCAVHDRSKHLESLERALGLQDGAWVGLFEFNHTWSEAELELSFVAVDEYGNVSSENASVKLPKIDQYVPTVLAWNDPEGRFPVERMRLVAGTPGGYTVGGRPDETENRTFREYGLRNYDDKPLEISWNLPPREVAAFFLDEREVSVGQYLRFLESEPGYGSAEWWPAEPASSRRRQELIDALRSRESDHPVTDVSWDEAVAYARWAGKRLPTFSEWEYAVRGGTAYRPFSSASTDAGLPSEAEFNYNPSNRPEGKGTWNVDQGSDVTVDTHIRDLCSNVGEWTRSVPSLDHSLLDPPEDAVGLGEERWIVGGHFRRDRVDFAVAERRRRSETAPNVGFRCALSQEAGIQAHETGQLGRWRIEGSDE